MTKHHVILSIHEEEQLRRMTTKGKSLARDILRAHILLSAHEKRSRREIARQFNCSYSHVCNTIHAYSQKGLEAVRDRPRKGKKPKLQGKELAHLIAIACSEPPEGRRFWTMQLLADKCIELNLVEFISDETVRRTLKKMKSSHGKLKVGVSQK